MLLLFPVLAGCSGPTADTGVVVASSDDTAPQTVETIAAEGWPALVINEFMASNQGTVTDGTGSYSDWLELYNPTDQTVTWNVVVTVEGTLNNVWNAVANGDSGRVRFSGAGWNSDVEPGQRVGFGFCSSL